MIFGPVNIKDISLDTLLTEEGFNECKYQAYNYIDSLDYSNAASFANFLDIKIKNFKPTTSNESLKIKVLTFWVNRLKLFAFSELSVKEGIDLIKSHTLEIIKNNLDILTAFFLFFDLYGSEKVILDNIKFYNSALLDNQEILGSSSKFGDINFKPTVANWLKEYQSSLNTRSVGNVFDPGTFSIIKFIDSNTYVKFLNLQEKDWLKEIIEIYNWFLTPISEIQTKAVNENKSNIEPQLAKDPNLKVNTELVVQKFDGAKNASNLNSEFSKELLAGQNLKPQAGLPPIVPRPSKAQAPAVSTPPILRSPLIKPSDVNNNPKAGGTVRPLPAKQKAVEKHAPADLINKIRSQDPLQPILEKAKSLPTQTEATSEDLKAAFVNKKLEELEKRIKNHE